MFPHSKSQASPHIRTRCHPSRMSRIARSATHSRNPGIPKMNNHYLLYRMRIFLRSPSLFQCTHCSFRYLGWCQKQLSKAQDTERHSPALSQGDTELSTGFGKPKGTHGKDGITLFAREGHKLLHTLTECKKTVIDSELHTGEGCLEK